MKKKVKKAPSADTSKIAITGKQCNAVNTAKEDIADIFNVMQSKKSSTSKKEPKGPCGSSGKASGNSDEEKCKLAESHAAADNLYRAPKKTLDVSDEVFFNTGSGRKGNSKKGQGDHSVNEAVLRREGVGRILSLAELQKMTSSNPKAGTTPNCPFDCNCCF